jgi:hypothetical protein
MHKIDSGTFVRTSKYHTPEPTSLLAGLLTAAASACCCFLLNTPTGRSTSPHRLIAILHPPAPPCPTPCPCLLLSLSRVPHFTHPKRPDHGRKVSCARSRSCELATRVPYCPVSNPNPNPSLIPLYIYHLQPVHAVCAVHKGTVVRSYIAVHSTIARWYMAYAYARAYGSWSLSSEGVGSLYVVYHIWLKMGVMHIINGTPAGRGLLASSQPTATT